MLRTDGLSEHEENVVLVPNTALANYVSSDAKSSNLGL